MSQTGTLTEDGLDMWGAVACTNGVLVEAETDISKLNDHPLFEGMLVCHSLTFIDGELYGDPLDAKVKFSSTVTSSFDVMTRYKHHYTLQMFESTKWILTDSNSTNVNRYGLIAPIVVKPPENLMTDMIEITEIGIIQQYQFSSSLQRMSVIVHALGSDHIRAYTKGSPEMIISLSKPETVPKDISLILEQFTKQGFRVIAMGRKTIVPKSSLEVTSPCIRAPFSLSRVQTR